MALSTIEREKLIALIGAIEIIREVSPDMQAQQMLTFLRVALEEGIAQHELAGRLNIAISSTSRNVRALTDSPRLGVSGHGLIASREDPREARRKLQTLTPKGRGYLARILES